jgi:hypothetical protein
MKKTIFAIATVMALISCGGSSDEVVATEDSTFIVDSIYAADTAAVVADTTTPANVDEPAEEVK